MPGRRAASLTEAQARVVSLETKVAFVGLFLHSAAQTQSLAGCPWNEAWQRLLSILVGSVVYIFPAFFPSSYIRWHDVFLSAFKLVFFSFPLLRKPRGIQRVMNAPATPGVFGAALDVIKMAWGSRLFLVLICGIGFPLSPWLQLVIQLYSTAMIRANPSLCQEQLMKDPLTAFRVNVFSQLAPSLLVGIVAGKGAECSFSLTFLHLFLGVLVPMFTVLLPKWSACSSREDGQRVVLLYLWLGLSMIITTAIIVAHSTEF